MVLNSDWNDDLYSAVENHSLKNAEKAISRGADVNAFINNVTCLHYAVEENNPEMVDFLLNHGANVCLTDHLGRTPLFLAAVRGLSEVLPKLAKSNPAALEMKANSGNNPLITAASYNFTQVVQALVQAGANVNVTNKFRQTPLMFAAYYNNREMLNILINAGADLKAKDENNKTAFMIAYRHQFFETAAHLAATEHIKENDLNALKNGMRNLLTVSATMEKINADPLFKEAMIKELIQAGALVTLKNADGKSVYATLAKNASPNLLFYLNEAKVKEEKIARKAVKLIQTGKGTLSALTDSQSLSDMKRTLGILTHKLIVSHQRDKMYQKAMSEKKAQHEKSTD